MPPKRRLSATVDAELLSAGNEAVTAGSAESLSAWVNEALRRQAEHDRRLRALGEFVAAFEAEHGEISDTDIAEAGRWAKERAILVRGSRSAA